MQGIEKILAYAFGFGFPALALLTALQPFGWFYVASTCASIALLLWCVHDAMPLPDAPVGLFIGLYFAFVAAAFAAAHALKYLLAAVRLLVWLFRWAYRPR